MKMALETENGSRKRSIKDLYKCLIFSRISSQILHQLVLIISKQNSTTNAY